MEGRRPDTSDVIDLPALDRTLRGMAGGRLPHCNGQLRSKPPRRNDLRPGSGISVGDPICFEWAGRATSPMFDRTGSTQFPWSPRLHRCLRTCPGSIRRGRCHGRLRPEPLGRRRHAGINKGGRRRVPGPRNGQRKTRAYSRQPQPGPHPL